MEIKIEWSFDLSPITRSISKGNEMTLETPVFPHLLLFTNKPRGGENQSAHQRRNGQRKCSISHLK